MLDEGYGQPGVGANDERDPKMLRLGQLQDALLRNARFIVGIEMHTGKMTFDQGVEFFEKEGYQTARERLMRNQARHFRPDLSLLHARQTADSEAARGLASRNRARFFARGISRRFHAAGLSADQDRAPGHARRQLANALVKNDNSRASILNKSRAGQCPIKPAADQSKDRSRAKRSAAATSRGRRSPYRPSQIPPSGSARIAPPPAC